MELRLNSNKKDDSSVQPLMNVKLEQYKKDDQTKQPSDKDQSQQSKSTSDSSKTDSAGIKQASKSQLHVKNKEDSKPQHTDTNIVKADAPLEPESSKKQKNDDSVTEGDAEQLTAVKSGIMEEEGHPQPQSESELKDEAAHKDSELGVIDNEPLMGSTEQLTAEVASSAELKTDQVQEALNNEAELPQITESPESPSPAAGSPQVAEIQDKEKPDDVCREKESEHFNEKISSSEADMSGTEEQSHVISAPCDGKETSRHDLTERDKKHSEQSQPKHEVKRKERSSIHSQRVDKGAAFSDRRRSRDRSEANSSRYAAASDRQHSSHRRRERYKPDVQHSRQDARERYSHRDSMKREAHGHECEKFNYHYDHHGHVYYITRRSDHSREMERYDRHTLSDLEDISDDETVYKDCGSHCCRLCQDTFETISSLLEHLQSAAHEQVKNCFSFLNFQHIFELP